MMNFVQDLLGDCGLGCRFLPSGSRYLCYRPLTVDDNKQFLSFLPVVEGTDGDVDQMGAFRWNYIWGRAKKLKSLPAEISFGFPG